MACDREARARDDAGRERAVHLAHRRACATRPARAARASRRLREQHEPRRPASEPVHRRRLGPAAARSARGVCAPGNRRQARLAGRWASRPRGGRRPRTRRSKDRGTSGSSQSSRRHVSRSPDRTGSVAKNRPIGDLHGARRDAFAPLVGGRVRVVAHGHPRAPSRPRERRDLLAVREAAVQRSLHRAHSRMRSLFEQFQTCDCAVRSDPRSPWTTSARSSRSTPTAPGARSAAGSPSTSPRPRAATSGTPRASATSTSRAQLMCSNLGHQNQARHRRHLRAGAGARVHRPGVRVRRAREARAEAARGHAQGAREVLLRDLGHRGQRGGDQDRARLHRQAQDHRALHVLPRLDGRLDRGRPATCGAGSSSRSRQDPRRDLRARGATATAARSAGRTPSAASRAPTTSPT